MMQILLPIHILAGTITLLSAIMAVLSEKGKKLSDCRVIQNSELELQIKSIHNP